MSKIESERNPMNKSGGPLTALGPVITIGCNLYEYIGFSYLQSPLLYIFELFDLSVSPMSPISDDGNIRN